MSKETRIYAVISWSNLISEGTWAELKAQGIIEDHSTLRKNLAGDQIIIKWPSGNTPDVYPERFIFQGSLTEMHQYLSDNKADWEEEDIL